MQYKLLIMPKRTRILFGFLYILAWIIFIGLCIEAGGFLTNAIFAIANPDTVKYLYNQVDLTSLFNYDTVHFGIVTGIISITTMIKAHMFYIIIKTMHDKKLNLSQPFNADGRKLISRISWLALAIGLFSVSGIKYSEWLVTQGVTMPDTQYLRFGGADVWIFMSIILFILLQIFKRGIEIQNENDLTV